MGGWQQSGFPVLRPWENLADFIQAAGVNGVERVPSSAWLVGVEKVLPGKWRQRPFCAATWNACHSAVTYILMDCPPALGVLTVNALAGNNPNPGFFEKSGPLPEINEVAVVSTLSN